MSDLISREVAIKALENTKRSDPFDRYESQNIGIEWAIDALKALPAAQPEKCTEERTKTHACDLRRYTFGNDEFNLEAAYHDCKLVFDGITDDDSFQEADTGLILYYANEIIYALHEALQGDDTNVLSNDCISRAAAIREMTSGVILVTNNNVDAVKKVMELFIDKIKNLPPVEPKRETGKWLLSALQNEDYTRNGNYLYICSNCGKGDLQAKSVNVSYCWNCGAHMEGRLDDSV